MNTRLFVLVSELGERPSVHFTGLPPELADGKDSRKPLPSPRVLVIEERPDGIFLFRFAKDGSSGGDTWHASIDDAKQQATHEYGTKPDEWRAVPENVTNVVVFAIGETQ